MFPGAHRTREGGEARSNSVEVQYLGLGTHQPKQADEEQQKEVTFQICAVRVCQFCENISRQFLSDCPRWDFFSACPQERTEREDAGRRDREEEDRNKVEAAHRPKQTDEEQQQKVTSQRCAVRVFSFCACISR